MSRASRHTMSTKPCDIVWSPDDSPFTIYYTPHVARKTENIHIPSHTKLLIHLLFPFLSMLNSNYLVRARAPRRGQSPAKFVCLIHTIYTSESTPTILLKSRTPQMRRALLYKKTPWNALLCIWMHMKQESQRRRHTLDGWCTEIKSASANVAASRVVPSRWSQDVRKHALRRGSNHWDKETQRWSRDYDETKKGWEKWL